MALLKVICWAIIFIARIKIHLLPALALFLELCQQHFKYYTVRSVSTVDNTLKITQCENLVAACRATNTAKT